ncbi:Rpn family recombination-promoting nuclease/putative transposase, partial [Acinetobacter baumannii]
MIVWSTAMERATNSPHDAVFKHLLSHRATARDFLDIH